MPLDQWNIGSGVSRRKAWRDCGRVSGPGGPGVWTISNSGRSTPSSDKHPGMWGWAEIYGMAKLLPLGFRRSMRLIWEHGNANVFAGIWAFGSANHVPPLRKQIPINRRRIKKTPNIDERLSGGSLGHRRSALSAAWFPLPDVDSAGNQRSCFAACSHAAKCRILWRCAAAGWEISVLPRDG